MSIQYLTRAEARQMCIVALEKQLTNLDNALYAPECTISVDRFYGDTEHVLAKKTAVNVYVLGRTILPCSTIPDITAYFVARLGFYWEINWPTEPGQRIGQACADFHPSGIYKALLDSRAFIHLDDYFHIVDGTRTIEKYLNIKIQ